MMAALYTLVGASLEMDFKFLEVVGINGFSFALIVAVLGFFWKADEALSTSFRNDLSRAIIDTNIPSDRNIWLDRIKGISDALLGRETFERKSFVRIFIFSSLIFLISSTLILKANDALTYRTIILVLVMYAFVGIPSILSMATIISSIIRILFYHVVKGGNSAAYFILGLLSSWAIMQVYQIIVIAIVVATNYFTGFLDSRSFGDFSRFLLDHFTWNGQSIDEMEKDDFLFAVYSFTSIPILAICLLPSLIILMSGIGLLLTKWASGLNRTKATLSYVLPVDERPIRAIGIVVSAAMSIVAMILWLIP
ncbi:MAG: hypothetical protein KF914_01215 [Rhizobiaceae bacterium]|nr:hypothetical protein [Rhizobiaceae bacterium]